MCQLGSSSSSLDRHAKPGLEVRTVPLARRKRGYAGVKAQHLLADSTTIHAEICEISVQFLGAKGGQANCTFCSYFKPVSVLLKLSFCVWFLWGFWSCLFNVKNAIAA